MDARFVVDPAFRVAIKDMGSGGYAVVCFEPGRPRAAADYPVQQARLIRQAETCAAALNAAHAARRSDVPEVPGPHRVDRGRLGSIQIKDGPGIPGVVAFVMRDYARHGHRTEQAERATLTVARICVSALNSMPPKEALNGTARA